MAFPLERKIEAYTKAWAEETAIRLKSSLERALKDGQPLRRGSQEASLNFNDNVKVGDGKVSFQILATGDYWVNIEDGRGKGKGSFDPNKVGNKSHGINVVARVLSGTTDDIFRGALRYQTDRVSGSADARKRQGSGTETGGRRIQIRTGQSSYVRILGGISETGRFSNRECRACGIRKQVNIFLDLGSGVLKVGVEASEYEI
jgi:hypothetical protein